MIDAVLYALALVGALTILGALWLAAWVAVSILRVALRHQREAALAEVQAELDAHDEQLGGAR